MRSVKQQLGHKVHFITKTKFGALVDHNSYIDRVWTIDSEITEIVDKLKEEKFDLIIDLHKNLRSKRLIYSLGAKAINFDKLNVQKWLRVHTPINVLPEKHLIDRYYDALQRIEVRNDGQGMDFFYDTDWNEICQKIELYSEPDIVIVLGATYPTKRVPEHIIQGILEHFKERKIVLLGGPDVTTEAENLKLNHPEIINGVGKLSLQESATVIDHSSCVVTGDTGMMHIAAALKKPIVSIWGGTHKDLGMYPYYGTAYPDKNISIVNNEISCSPCSKIGKQKCPKGHFKCMLDLNPERVIQAISSQVNS